MGALLEPTPDMGPWVVEVGRESAYLSGDVGGYKAWREGEQPDPPRHTVYGHEGIGIAVLPEDLPCVLAALEQITEHPGFREWARNKASAILEASLAWHSEFADGMVRAYGPVIVYGDEEPWAPVGSVELTYEAVAALRMELAVEHYERTGKAWTDVL
jgi:hypothetical protein